MTILQALWHFDGSTPHWIIIAVRLPRSLLAVTIGAALGVAGTVMQGLTRNPLASPQLLGVNAGGVLAVVGGMCFFPHFPMAVYTSLALLGAGLAAVLVYTVGQLGEGGLTSLNLTLTGVALTAFLSSFTTGLLLINQRTFDEVRFWLVGSLEGVDLASVGQVVPLFILGLGLGLGVSRSLTALSLGEDVAEGLGVSSGGVKGLAIVAVVCLAGGSVAIAGSIGFIGLMIPHIAQFFSGLDYQWKIPYAALLGAILLLLADSVARIIFYPETIPVGLVTPLLGVPMLFIVLKDNG